MLLKSVDEVVDALGGTAEAAGLVGVGLPAVSNWRARRAIPAEHFLVLSTALGKIGRTVDPSVFGFHAVESRS